MAQTTIATSVGQNTIKELLLPSVKGLAAGTYNLCIVVASNGEVSLRVTEPIADATIAISGLTSITVKDGIIVSKIWWIVIYNITNQTSRWI